MLSEIRDRSSGAFAYFIAALIIIPMAFWGIQEYATTQAVPTLVEVGDMNVTQADLDQRLRQVQDAERQRNPELANSDLFSTPFFKRSVLNSLVDRVIVEQHANDYNYRLGNAQLASIIKEQPLFQNDAGEFNQQAYDEFVQSRLYSKQRFEQQVRDDSRIAQVSEGYQESAFVMPDELRGLLAAQAEQRTFDLVTVSESEYLQTIEVSDEAVQERYQNALDEFMEPDRMSVEYVELDVAQIAESIEVIEDDLRAIYEDNKENYIAPESRSASHILLTTGGDESDEAQKALAESLLEQLNQGADFAELAAEYSDDPGSASQGGDLGLIQAGVMVPEFEQAAFALAEGEISAPIKTQFGYHLIQVTDVSGGEAQSFDEVRFDLAEEFRQQEAQNIFAARLEEMKNLVFESESSLEPVAQALETSIRTTDLFSRDEGEGIAANAEFRRAAFDPVVLEDDLNSDPVEIAGGVQVAVRKLDFIPSAPKPLADVEEQIRDQLTREAASEAAAAAVASLQERAQTSWDSIRSDETLKIGTYTASWIQQPADISRELMDKVSTMTMVGNEPTIETFEASNGDFHVIRLSQVMPGDLTAVSDQIKDATRRVLEDRNGSALFTSYLYQQNQIATKDIDDEAL